MVTRDVTGKLPDLSRPSPVLQHRVDTLLQLSEFLSEPACDRTPPLCARPKGCPLSAWRGRMRQGSAISPGGIGLWRHRERSRSSRGPEAASGEQPHWRCTRTGFRWCSPGAAARCWKRRPHSPERRRRRCLWCQPIDQASIASLFDTVKATYGRIDLLFNNAGISTRNMPFEDLTVEQWSNVVAVNLTGSFLCAQHAFRMMKSQEPRGGRIINSRMQPCRGLVTQGTAIRQRARWRRSLARDQPRAGRMFAGARDDLRHDQGAATGAETPAGLTGSATVKAYVLYIDWRVSSHARPGADVRVIGAGREPGFICRSARLSAGANWADSRTENVLSRGIGCPLWRNCLHEDQEEELSCRSIKRATSASAMRRPAPGFRFWSRRGVA